MQERRVVQRHRFLGAGLAKLHGGWGGRARWRGWWGGRGPGTAAGRLTWRALGRCSVRQGWPGGSLPVGGTRVGRPLGGGRGASQRGGGAVRVSWSSSSSSSCTESLNLSVRVICESFHLDVCCKINDAIYDYRYVNVWLWIQDWGCVIVYV
jgi:hypothetical protein